MAEEVQSNSSMISILDIVHLFIISLLLLYSNCVKITISLPVQLLYFHRLECPLVSLEMTLSKCIEKCKEILGVRRII